MGKEVQYICTKKCQADGHLVREGETIILDEDDIKTTKKSVQVLDAVGLSVKDENGKIKTRVVEVTEPSYLKHFVKVGDAPKQEAKEDPAMKQISILAKEHGIDNKTLEKIFLDNGAQTSMQKLTELCFYIEKNKKK